MYVKNCFMYNLVEYLLIFVPSILFLCFGDFLYLSLLYFRYVLFVICSVLEKRNWNWNTV